MRVTKEIKEGIFIRPQTKGTDSRQFDEDLNETERKAWLSFKRICKDILGNHKAASYQVVVQDLLTSYTAMGCKYESGKPLYEVTLGFLPRKSRQSQ
jgi:hypothetical protein